MSRSVVCWLRLLLWDHCLLPITEHTKVSFKKSIKRGEQMTHRETVLNNIRIRIQKNCCKMHIARFRGRKYALLQLNSKNLKPSRQKQLTFPASKHRLRTTKLKRQQKEIKCFSPHNPFPDKQTSGFQIPHRLPPHGRPRYWPCGPPVGRKW